MSILQLSEKPKGTCAEGVCHRNLTAPGTTQGDGVTGMAQSKGDHSHHGLNKWVHCQESHPITVYRNREECRYRPNRKR